ncbi:hypothetical protein [Devosia submarina]|uniref:hypothetical protein n=1 Tax=Devosia submarina TaxID=1173082 RepID=UPI000D3D3C26|nr:hypothetical protein [Devosia submarina]
MSINQPLQQATDDNIRSARRKKADRLRHSLEAMLRSHRGLVVLGTNQLVTELARRQELDEHDFCQFDIMLKSRRICLVCVPQVHWNNPASMTLFNEVKAAAKASGHEVLLAPEALVGRPQRLDNSRVTFGPEYEVSGTDRMTVISYLLKNGGGTLAQLAGLLRHPDPVGAVLHLGVIGAIDIDLNAAIAPATTVRFKQVR